MKASIPTPVIVIVIVAVLAVAGLLLMRSNRGASNAEVQTMSKEMNAGKPSTAPLSKGEAQGDAMMMGKKGGK